MRRPLLVEISSRFLCLVGGITFLCSVLSSTAEEKAPELERPHATELIKSISKSPDGNGEIFTILPKGDDVATYKSLEDLIYTGPGYHLLYKGAYLKDLRNKDGGWQRLSEEREPCKIGVQWAGDSSWVNLHIGDEKSWGHDLFVRHYDTATGHWIYRKPDLPDLKKVITGNTAENPVIFAPATQEQRELDPNNFAFWEQSSALDVTPATGGQGRFAFIMKMGVVSFNGRIDRELQGYTVTFETSDWVKFDLKKIVRNGLPQSNAYKPDQNRSQPLIMFPAG